MQPGKYDVLPSQIQHIGIGAPGIVKNGIINDFSNIKLENFEIAKIIKEKTGLDTYVKNDAKCAGIAENLFGEMSKYSDSVFLTIGTGIGGAVFINNELQEGKNYAGYEIGHMIIDANNNNAKCNCGKTGCFEALASMRKLKQMVGDNISHIPEQYIDNLSIGISNLINIFEPEIVVLGGSIAFYEELVLDKLKQNINQYCINEFSNIKCAKLKNDAGIIGAAYGNI